MLHKYKYLSIWLSTVAIFSLGYGFGNVVPIRTEQTVIITTPSYITNALSSGIAHEGVETKQAQADFATFWQVWNVLDENYALPASTTVTASDRIDGAILGLTESYGDPYTTVFIKKDATDFKEQVSGQFEGIGAVLNQIGEYVVVQHVLEGSPASRAGVQTGDFLLQVNSTPLVDVDMAFAVQNIRGPKDSIATLQVLRDKTILVIEVTRDSVAIQSAISATADEVTNAVETIASTIVNKVRNTFIQEGNIENTTEDEQSEIDKVSAQADDLSRNLFVMRLAIFSESSSKQIKKELTDYVSSGKRDLIIDLRGNPGGVLDVAEDFASYFLPKGAVVAKEVFGKTGQEISYRSYGYTLLPQNDERQIVILLDSNSASASEIFAAALRDAGVATIIGTQSYGKGSVQQMLDVNDHLTLKLTVARWYTPLGATIDKVGITPDIIVDIETATSGDPIFERAVEYLLQ